MKLPTPNRHSLEPSLERLGRAPLWLRLALVTSVSAAVGYLIELAILSGSQWCDVLLSPPTVWFTLWAGFCIMVLAILWILASVSGQSRGSVVHLAMLQDESWRPRHEIEAALLRAHVSSKWPRAGTLAPVIGVARSVDEARTFACRAAETLRCATQISPYPDRCTMLVAGPSHLSIALGAMLAQTAPRAVRMLADVTDTTNPSPGWEPKRWAQRRHAAVSFLDFRLPRNDTRPTLESESPQGSEGLLFAVILKRGDNTLKQLSESLSLPMHEVDTTAFTRETGGRWMLPETPRAYELLMDRILADLLDKARRCDRVWIVTDAPASIAFATGLLASRLGLSVGTVPHDFARGYDAAHASEPVSALETSAPAATRRVDGSQWGRALRATTAVAALALPFVLGSVATALEWVLGGSGELDQPSADGVLGRTAAQWAVLALVMLVSAAALWFARREQRRLLDAPSIQIVDDPAFRLAGRPTMANRWIIRSTALPVTARDSASEANQWIKHRLRDVHYAFPAVTEISIHLGDEVANPKARLTDLVRSYRGPKPPTVHLNGIAVEGKPGVEGEYQMRLREATGHVVAAEGRQGAEREDTGASA